MATTAALLIASVVILCIFENGSGQSYPGTGTGDPELAELGEATLSGPNVCTRRVRQSGYVTRNVTFSCWRTVSFSCSEFEVRRSQDPRCRRTSSRCYTSLRGNCSRIERVCVTGWATRQFCCQGYEEDGMGGCKRSIECSSNNGGCEQICRSDPQKGHYCDCLSGFNIMSQTMCEDVDECKSNNGGCEHECRNTIGSFFCTCKNGYRLENMLQCKEIDECSYGNGGCEHDCVNTKGAFYCECKPGYELYKGVECVDIDECEAYGANGGCDHECINLQGGYKCVCDEGYLLEKDNKTCKATGIFPGEGEGKEIPNEIPILPPGEGPRDESGTRVDFLGQSRQDQSAVLGSGVGIGCLILILLIPLILIILRRKRKACFARNPPHPVPEPIIAATAASGNKYQSTYGFKPPKVPLGYTNLGYDSKESIKGEAKIPKDDPPAYDNQYAEVTDADDHVYDDVVPTGSISPPPYTEKPEGKSASPVPPNKPLPVVAARPHLQPTAPNPPAKPPPRVFGKAAGSPPASPAGRQASAKPPSRVFTKVAGSPPASPAGKQASAKPPPRVFTKAAGSPPASPTGKQVSAIPPSIPSMDELQNNLNNLRKTGMKEMLDIDK